MLWWSSRFAILFLSFQRHSMFGNKKFYSAHAISDPRWEKYWSEFNFRLLLYITLWMNALTPYIQAQEVEFYFEVHPLHVIPVPDPRPNSEPVWTAQNWRSNVYCCRLRACRCGEVHVYSQEEETASSQGAMKDTHIVFMIQPIRRKSREQRMKRSHSPQYFTTPMERKISLAANMASEPWTV